jgi:hypothetical protein
VTPTLSMSSGIRARCRPAMRAARHENDRYPCGVIDAPVAATRLQLGLNFIST